MSVAVLALAQEVMIMLTKHATPLLAIYVSQDAAQMSYFARQLASYRHEKKTTNQLPALSISTQSYPNEALHTNSTLPYDSIIPMNTPIKPTGTASGCPPTPSLKPSPLLALTFGGPSDLP